MKIIKKMLYLEVLIISISFLMACTTLETEQQASMLHDAARNNMRLGLAYLAQKDAARAKEKLLTAFSQMPKDSEIQDALAYYFEKTGDVINAEKYYSAALERGVEHNGVAFNNYGAFLCRQKKTKEAEKMFLTAVSDPYYLHTASAYNNAAWCAITRRDFQAAQIYFEKAKRYNLDG